MRYPDKLEEVRDVIGVDDFYYDAHQKIYGSILRLNDKSLPIDIVGVGKDLEAAKQIDDVGGVLYLAELVGECGFNHEWHVHRMQEAALRRGLIHSAVESANESYAGSAPAGELLDRSQERLERLAARGIGPEATPITEAVNRTLDTIDARVRGERDPGLPTMFTHLDSILCGGLGVGQLTTLAARPSVGKTSFALHVTRNVCAVGKSVLVVSLEQPEQELTERLLAGVSGVNGGRIRQGKFRQEDTARLGQAADAIRSWKLLVSDRPTQTAGQIAAGARRSRRKARGLDLVVVDYLGLVESDNRKANRNEQVATSVRRLRAMARELNVPVLLCCQLNRDAAGDQNPPQLHQLRESGEIEQVSDAVVFLHRTGRNPDGEDMIQVRVAKQRNGPTANVEFVHETSVYSFREVAILD